MELDSAFLISKAAIIRETVISQFLNQGSFHFKHSIASQLSHILESFILVIMLSRTFRVREKVQVLDAVTSIWESAVILSLISDWCVKIKWSDWPGSAIFSVPEDRKENATAWNIRKYHEHNDTCVISRRRSSRKDKISFNPRRLHRDSVFFEHTGSVKKGIVIINDPLMSQCTVRMVDRPQDTAGNGPSCSGNLYVRYSELRNESQGKSRKRVARKSLPGEFLKFMITDAEKSRPEQKP